MACGHCCRMRMTAGDRPRDQGGTAMTEKMLIELATGLVSRRRFVWGTGALAASTALWRPTLARAADPIKIGYVSPKTGPLAPFAEADGFILGGIRKLVGSGLDIGGTSYPVEI